MPAGNSGSINDSTSEQTPRFYTVREAVKVLRLDPVPPSALRSFCLSPPGENWLWLPNGDSVPVLRPLHGCHADIVAVSMDRLLFDDDHSVLLTVVPPPLRPPIVAAGNEAFVTAARPRWSLTAGAADRRHRSRRTRHPATGRRTAMTSRRAGGLIARRTQQVDSAC
jgi:hypothetical protein